MFEFVGDEYNYKYLYQYAKEEARKYMYSRLRSMYQKAMREFGVSTYYPRLNDCDAIKIYSFKREDRIHVYCEIDEGEYRRCVDEAVKLELSLKEKSNGAKETVD